MQPTLKGMGIKLHLLGHQQISRQTLKPPQHLRMYFSIPSSVGIFFLHWLFLIFCQYVYACLCVLKSVQYLVSNSGYK